MFKKTVFRLAVFGLFFAAGTAGVFAQSTVSLDEALQESANSIEKSLKKGTIVAVVNFTSGSARLSDYVIQEL
ncbi:MAG: hypothetical protein LBT00_01370, partial [Spirochaetaceae bacterium]|nr:hypothetical protein [Spirochaetaceae bacterium]